MRKKNILWKVTEGIIFLNVMTMLIVVIIQVVGRTFSSSLPWTEELTRYCFLWTVNFGMTIGLLEASHASVTIVFCAFKKHHELAGKIRMWIYFISCFVFFLLASYWNLGMTRRQMGNYETSPALGLPMYYVTLPLFICDILAILALIQSVFFEKEAKDIISLKTIEIEDQVMRVKEGNV